MQSKIIFITGDLMNPRNRLFIQENRLPVLTKPFGIQELRQQVEAVLAGSFAKKTDSHSTGRSLIVETPAG
jgi:DNA-binding response OmpR family regulator